VIKFLKNPLVIVAIIVIIILLIKKENIHSNIRNLFGQKTELDVNDMFGRSQEDYYERQIVN
jgi:hypothetical protein